MAVVSRTATLRLDDTATHSTNILSWVATAATQDTPAGQSVVITTVRTVAGVPPADPETLTLRLYTDTGATVASFTLDVTAPSQTSTFHFTADGGSGAAARAGTLEIALRATRTTVPTYDIETDGSPNTAPATFDTHLDRGWIRGTTTATTGLSNVALGGAKASPAEYDESLFARTTLGAVLYVARALTVAISGATPALSGATNSTASGNWDSTFANVVDDRFGAAVTAAASSLTVPNAALTGQPDTVLTATNDSINVDPRLTASHHFQVDDNTFALSKNDTSKAMLSTQSGFLATRFVTARSAAGVNSLTVTQTLTPVGPGIAVSASSATATRDTQAGWTELLAWTSSKPGGTWNKTVDITAPTDIDADPHVLSGTDAYIMLAPDPRIVLRGYMNKTDSQRRHFTAGDPVVVSMTVIDLTTRIRIDPARVTEPAASFVRYVSSTNRLETLATDGSWSLWEPGAPAALFALLPSPNDARNYIRAFTDTAAWTRDVMAILFTCKVDGTPYSGFQSREEVGISNAHDGGGILTAQTTIAP